VYKKKYSMSEKTLEIGKHAGKTFEEIKSNDISYCNWVLKQLETRGKMKEFQDWLKQRSRKVTCTACNGSGLAHSM